MNAWWDRTWCVYDLETTNVEPAEAHVVQMGLAIFRGGRPASCRSTLVNPGVHIPEEATAVHGITDEQVANARTESEAILAFCGWIAKSDERDVCLVTYNGINYDDRVLDVLSRKQWSRAITRLPRVDVLTIIRMDGIGRWWKGKGRHRLGAVALRLGVEVGDDSLHDASSDCVLTGRVLAALLADELHGPHIREQLPGDVDPTRKILALGKTQEEDFQRWLAKQPPRPAESGKGE